MQLLASTRVAPPGHGAGLAASRANFAWGRRMYFCENDDAFSPLCRFLDRRLALTREELRTLGYGRRMVECAVKYALIRPVAPGLLGLEPEWFGHLQEEVLFARPLGTRGVTVRCFTPLRTFAALAAAGSLDSAGDLERVLLERGERPEVLLEALLRLGLPRGQSGNVMFEVLAPLEHRTPPVDE